jgi:hypothetical protein
MKKYSFTQYVNRLLITMSLLIWILCLSTSCNKDDDLLNDLPKATQTGANTFGCLVNGEPWVAEIGLGIFTPSLRKIDMVYDETDTGLFNNNNWGVRSKRVTKDSINEGFVFTANNFDNPVFLNRNDNKLIATFRSINLTPSVYYLDTLQVYTIEITNLDTMKNICSGVFDFYVLSADKSDTLHITDGRFDGSYLAE